MTGRPVPPSVELFAAVSVYTQPAVSVTVPFEPFAAEMAETRLATEHGTVLARAGCAAAALAATQVPTTTAAAEIPRRSRGVICGCT